MTDYRKAPGGLGVKIHGQFCAPNAVVPVLRDLVVARGEVAQDYIAEQWGHTTGETVPKYLRGLIGLRETSLAHKDEWKFLLRAAQCAAMADRQMQARLVATEGGAAHHPKTAALETIYDLGQQSLALLGETTDTEFLTNPELTAGTWDRDTTRRIAQLGIRPHVFLQVIRGFAAMIEPGRLTGFLEEGVPESAQTLYRISTAAAVVGHQVQVEFVPFV